MERYFFCAVNLSVFFCVKVVNNRLSADPIFTICYV
jgi:hypothetical protein